MRRHVVALSVAAGSVVMLALAWLGVVNADEPATHGDVPSTQVVGDRATSADGGLVTPVSSATPAPTPVRQSRAS